VTAVEWNEVKRRVREERAAGRLPARTEADRAVARQRTSDYINAWHLAELRRERSLTQREVAEAMGVSGPRVSDIERGDLGSTSVAVLRAYVEALGGRLKLTAEVDGVSYEVAGSTSSLAEPEEDE
jgi:predicted XRE-type DNA-binding protein